MSQIIQICHQHFPSDVLKWMKTNATPPQALHLMKVCKYFQHQSFPYFVIVDLRMTEVEMAYSVFYGGERGDEWYEIDEENLNDLPNNLWITSELDIRHEGIAFSAIFSKIAYCEISWLTLYNQKISYNEYKKLTEAGGVEFCKIFDTLICYDNVEEIASLEDLLECLPNIQQLTISANIPPIISLDRLNNIVRQSSWSFVIYKVDETFDINLFAAFMKANQKINYSLHFHADLPLEYLQQLQSARDEFEEIWSSECRLPRFVF